MPVELVCTFGILGLATLDENPVELDQLYEYPEFEPPLALPLNCTVEPVQ